MKGADYYNKVYSGKYYIDMPLLRMVASLCRGKVLDIGCGDATLATIWEGPYMGLDFSEVVVEKARDKVVTPLGIHVVDVLKEPLPLSHSESPYGGPGGSKWETIVMQEFLEHVTEEADDILFPKVREVLAPGGRIIVTVPRGQMIPEPAHCRVFSEESLVAKLVTAFGGELTVHPHDRRYIVASVDTT